MKKNVTSSADELGRPVTRFANGELGAAVARYAGDVLTALEARLNTATPNESLYLKPVEAAKLLCVSRQFFYSNEKKLPFVVRLSTGALRISRPGLLAWARNGEVPR